MAASKLPGGLIAGGAPGGGITSLKGTVCSRPCVKYVALAAAGGLLAYLIYSYASGAAGCTSAGCEVKGDSGKKPTKKSGKTKRKKRRSASSARLGKSTSSSTSSTPGKPDELAESPATPSAKTELVAPIDTVPTGTVPALPKDTVPPSPTDTVSSPISSLRTEASDTDLVAGVAGIVSSVAPGDITTQPSSKIVFNGPYDDKQTAHIKVTNSSARRIGWAFKSTNITRLGATPGCGVLDPKETALVAVSCDRFNYRLEKTCNDRVTIEWANAPEGSDTKQFSLVWFQGNGMVRRKNIPIEYNP